MTRYEQGFMNKCAEHGVDPATAIRLMEKSGATLASYDEVINPLKERLAQLSKIEGGTTYAPTPGDWYGHGGIERGFRDEVAHDAGILRGAIRDSRRGIFEATEGKGTIDLISLLRRLEDIPGAAKGEATGSFFGHGGVIRGLRGPENYNRSVLRNAILRALHRLR
jgi:hypothetical protein